MFRGRIGGLLLLGIVLVAMQSAGCGSDVTGPSIPIEQLLAAPEAVEIDGHSYMLECFLWRDFMPVSPPDGKPLVAHVIVSDVDSLDIPETISLILLWVIKGDEVWETSFSNESLPSTPPRQLPKIARNGPKWGPNIYVDVVVQIMNAGRQAFLLKAANQFIIMTE